MNWNEALNLMKEKKLVAHNNNIYKIVDGCLQTATLFTLPDGRTTISNFEQIDFLSFDSISAIDWTMLDEDCLG